MTNAKIDTFRDTYQAAATTAGTALGVSPDVLLSQWGLETGWGKSIIPGTNNLGNIKDFSAAGVAAVDNSTGTTDRYRKYDTPEAFAADFVSLIKRKYPTAVGAGNDPTKFAAALKQGGYAEDPNYVASITNTFNTLTGSSLTAPAQTAATGAQVAPAEPVAYSPIESFEGRGAPIVATPEVRQRSFTELPAATGKPAKVVAQKLTPYEETLELQTQAAAARAGLDTAGVVEVGEAVRANMPRVVEASLNNDATVAKVDASPVAGLKTLDDATAKARTAETEAQAVTFMDKARAAYNAGGLGSPIKALMDQLHLANVKKDPLPFNFMGDWESNLSGFDADEQDYLIKHGQGSQQAWTDAQMILLNRRQLSRKLAGGSKATTIGASLLVGAIDPVGLVAFAGVGKVAQLAGVGGAAFAAQGRGLAAVLATGVENVVGGVLLDTTLAAAGEHVTMNDFANSMGMNMGFGMGFGLLHLPRAARAKVDGAIQETSQLAAQREVALAQQAQDNLGAGATQQQVQVEMDRLQVKGMADMLDQTLAPVPGSRRLLPENLEGRPPLEPAIQAARETRYGTTNVADPAERTLFTDYYEGSERILRENTIDNTRQSQMLKAIGMESTGATMLQSKNPLLQALGVILTESSTGAAQRGQTAALARSMNHKLFVGDFNTAYERSYSLWARENGGSLLGDYTNGDHYRRFNKEVAKLIEDRHFVEGPLMPAHPAVQAAADLNWRGLDRMRQAAQKVGTVGAARLGDNSFGYMTRVMDATTIRALSEAKKKAVVNILADQFEDLSGWDRAFSQEHARRILSIHENRALGGVDMPLSIHDERMAGIVADSLAAANLPPERVAELLGKFSRGGANFTKGRTKLSLNTPYHIDGETFTLMDIVDTDVPKLYRAYAQRMAGEIALTQHGIQGRAGLETIRSALLHGPEGRKVTEAEMRAYDQVAAELLGAPFGTRSRPLDAAVMATSVVRLGGMGLTQLGETFNGIHAIGLSRTLATIPAMPRMIREVGQMLKTGQPKNRILGSIETLGGELGTEGYRHPIPFAQTDVIAKQAGVETYSTMERALRLGQNVQAKLSFHRAIMTAQVRGMSEQIVSKAFSFIRTGKELDGALKDMGITPEVAAALKADLPNIAKFDGAGKLTDLDLTKATNPVAVKEFIQAVHRGSAQIIQTTFVGETGKWAHDSFLKMLTQFRSFGMISVEKQYNRQAGVHGAAKAMGFMLGAMSFAIPIQLARLQASTLGMSRGKRDETIERGTDPFMLIRASMNYTSSLGLMPDMVEALSVPLGLEASDTGRGLSGDIGRIIPAAGLANDVLKAGKGVSTWSPLSDREAANPHDVMKGIMPLGRVPYVIPLVNALGTD